jgi:small subunit ribosomal protein S19
MTHFPHIYKTLVESKGNLNSLKVFSRSARILPWFVDKTVFVHNGKTCVSILVNSAMVNHRFGEFVYTKTRATFKSQKKK